MSDEKVELNVNGEWEDVTSYVLSDPTDKDETRRLLYGALAAGRTRRWELVGTLVNALVHHSGLVEDPYDLLDYLVEVVETPIAGAGGYERGQRMRDLIAQLSEPVPNSES